MSVKRTLHDGWTVTAGASTEPDSKIDVVDLPASVPGCVHTDLLAAGLIGDPYLDDTEQTLSWIGRTDWTYRTTFTHEAGPWDGVDLAFDGLDTVAQIRLNGTAIADTFNMHRRYRFEVDQLVREGANDLEVAFTSPYAYAEAQRDRLGDRPNAYPEPANFIRKAACNFGWDWGPNLAGVGIWRPVTLHAWNVARIRTVVPHATVIDGRGVVDVTVRIQRRLDTDVVIDCALAGVRKQVRVSAGSNIVDVRLEIEDPMLWWPRSHGEQPLYPLTVSLQGMGVQLDTWTREIGFRCVELDTDPDETGRPYTLKINGEPIVVRGVNWIPDDAILTRVDAPRLERRFTQAADANVNYLRVWGGGIYESEDFYNLADRMGFLVGQDFLFACAAYPEEEPFWTEVGAEARDNLDRLAHHPSLVTWTGNNENIWGWHDWDWQKELGEKTWGAGYYHSLLPKTVAEVDPTRPYWPGSPYSGQRDIHPNDQPNASTHIWDVWNEKDYVHYRDWKPRFVAEFGYQAPPTWATVRRMVTDEPLKAETPNMLWHQKAIGGQRKLQRGLDAHLPEVRDFDDWLYFTQVNQARAIRLGVEHFRSLQPYCMGSIMWQLNDCWPVTSWAAIDSEERLKPLWYALRDAFADRIATFQPGGEGGVKLVAVNDSATAWEESFGFWKCSAQGRILGRALLTVNVPARDVSTIELPEDVVPTDGGFLITAGDEVPRATWFTKEDQDMAWPTAEFGAEAAEVPGGLSVTVTAETVLRDLCLFADRLDPDALVDKALVTLVPGETVTFTVTSEVLKATPEVVEAITSKPVLRAVND